MLPRIRMRWVGLGVLVAAGLGIALLRPSNDRDWSPDQAVLPHVRLDGRVVRVYNIRNVRYQTPDRYTVAHYDTTFHLDSLESVWYLVHPFSPVRGVAHTMLSFGFAGGRYLAISVEIRKRRGQSYHPVVGLFRQYELMYVVADERDVIGLRSKYRADLYLYPVRASAQGRERLLLDMLRRANILRERPEFYNTLTNTCTTNIVRHVNAIAPRKVPFSYKVLLPGYSDELAYDLGLLDIEGPPSRVRQRYRITDRASAYVDSAEFSLRIRSRR